MTRLCWYGDDFTGSTDVLEALAPHMSAVLFLARPAPEVLSRFAGYEAIGLAGASRGEPPAWMDSNLPAVFEWMRSLGAPLCHYKVCSTFDSSPVTGSIGRAMEIGKRVFDSPFVPLVVGALPLRRYTAFGHLFAAAADGAIHRIDRHPTMMRHPVTPMDEADLRLHLARQTGLRIGVLPPLAPEGGYAALAATSEAVLIDVIDEHTERRAGSLLCGPERQPFVVGSSGVEYALLAHWGMTPPARPTRPKPAGRIVVLSGSCSPATERQIEHAATRGFVLLPVSPLDASSDGACGRSAVAALANGAPGVVMHTARTAADRVANLDAAGRKILSERAGRILDRVLNESGVRRAVIAGGDTSSHAASLLGIDALTFAAHLAPGAPLCQASSRVPGRHGLEIVFKGGQCGGADFFETVKGND